MESCGRLELENGYDGYIRVKKLARSGKNFVRTKNKQKQATSWAICATSGQKCIDR